MKKCYSESQGGRLIYVFDSRTTLSIQKHSFSAPAIARNPEGGGNYNGGTGNAHDLIMWGSLAGGSARQGETVAFQLPRDFDGFTSAFVDTTDFEARVMESVAWTTETAPAFSGNGKDVYFAINGNRFAGWNDGESLMFVCKVSTMITL